MANLIGKQLGNYTLTQLLGQGGFAEVYLGEHVYLKTPAAIKVLHAQLSGQDDTESFQREAQYIARLVHPNIIRVLDFGIAEQVPFLVMDYAPRGTLRQKHPRGTRLPLNTILPYVKQTAAALQHAHDERLIHRDIKPENMLLGRQGDVLLSDFGIALVAQSSRYQNTQDVIGTVAYMSPEQIQGKPRSASDQYSLAIVVYEWLTGVRPFNGSFTELCTQHMFATVPPMREQVPDISPQVEQVVNIALAKDYHQRFGSVKAFANALEQASQGQAPTTPPPYNVSSPHNPVILPPPNSSNQPAHSGERAPFQPAAVAPQEHATPSQPAATVPQEHVTPPQPVPSHAQLQRNVTPSAAFVPPDKPRQQGELPSTPQEQATPERRPNPWGLRGPQITAMVVAVILTSILEYIGSNWYFDVYISSFVFNYLFATAIALLFFFGTKFGPWVALVSGVAILVTDIMINGSGLYYSYGILYAAMGFVASLAYLSTLGNYRRFGALALAVGTSFAGLLLYVVGISYIYSRSSYVATNSGIFSLVLLVIMLLIANRFSKSGIKR
ncbi:serine/threonine protein kinase [Ktedonospora formicarum]|uniref:Protein kinase domain-containing protein n=1 Tax=Ktedonospora formicarum TaxID=2778364 RepID=A0A8J3I3G5_9CHLR|nr:serine/threonine-protein kinase [Ktedonospora formicarum]GHO48081.1 hypothetical protein KSX_62440 [Ktedonospora formicarum]